MAARRICAGRGMQLTVLHADPTEEGGWVATERLLRRGTWGSRKRGSGGRRRGTLPTACAVGSLNQMFGVMAALRAARLAVPADMSLVRLDEDECLAFLDVPVTSVAMPLAELGSAAVDALIARIDQGEPGEPGGVMICEPMSLVQRESVAGPPAGRPGQEGADRVRIRPAAAAELPALQDIERSAGEAFRGIGMPEIADDAPFSVGELPLPAGRAGLGRRRPGQPPVAYLVAELVDGDLHMEQVSVHPDWARRGVGRALMEHAAGGAAGGGLPALTPTTFADVPWNAPYYERLGFRPLPEAELTPGCGSPATGCRARPGPLAPPLHAPRPVKTPGRSEAAEG